LAEHSELPAYERPRVVDHGPFAELTRGVLLEVAHYAQFGAAFAASVISPGGPGVPHVPTPIDVPFTPQAPSGGGGGGGGLPGGTLVPSGGGAGGNVVTAAPAAAGPAGGGGGGAAGSSGGGGTLPFTGYAVALLAGVGLVTAAAGKTLRRLARR
jgi:hypothetical protein